jgi:hypothetical protein
VHTRPDSGKAGAAVDPVLRFDQAAFDARYGAESFSLSEYYSLKVSENLVAPEPARVRLSVTPATSGFMLQWIGSLTAQYQVQWAPTLVPPAWNTFTNVVTSTGDSFQFLDNGSQSGGLAGTRFYRVQQVPQ